MVSSWWAASPSKQWGERFFLAYSVYWISLFGSVVVTRVYMMFGDVEYMLLAVAVAAPSMLVPLLWPGKADRALPLRSRYWFKANVWIAIYSYIGNYFWTHYFFTVLNARYTFPITWNLNGVPICLYIITHAYFISYHSFSSLILRRFWLSSLYTGAGPLERMAWSSAVVFALGYVTAFMEAFTISSVPYYVFDSAHMYTVGAMFYGIYFYVSFPMFLQIDEGPRVWTAKEAALNSLAAGMLAFIFLDLWRLFVSVFLSAPSPVPWVEYTLR
jgi:cycloeucalenol cycloisomerase